MRTVAKNLLVIVFVVLLAGVVLAGDYPRPAPPNQVALFKNGLGFFISEVVLPKGESSYSFIPCAAASHGTFWVSYSQKLKLESLIAEETYIDIEQADAITIPELLKANVGKKIRINVSGRQLDGVITYYPDARIVDKPTPYAPGAGIEVNRNYQRYPQSQLMLFETEWSQMALRPDNVQKVEFLWGEPAKTFAVRKKSMQLNVALFEPAADDERLIVSFLGKGLTWAPSYIIDITEPDKARLSAKAVIINEACDLNNADIQLVTGFPNLQFADIISPMAKKDTLAGFLQSLIGGRSRQRGRRDAAIMSQRASYAPMEDEMMPDYGSAKAGRASEDLFFYPVDGVNLKQNQTGYYPLFTEAVPYKHIYKWDIPDYINEQSYRGGQPIQTKRPEVVWHCLKLENKTKVPWTTAPAQTVKDGLILGQDTLDYTPVEATATLRITQAVGIKAEQIELEKQRKRDALNIYGHRYDLVDVEGTLSVRNFQDKEIELEITKLLSGQPNTESVDGAKIEKLARGLKSVNETNRLTWNIKLKPGKSEEITYLYQVYVRR